MNERPTTAGVDGEVRAFTPLPGWENPTSTTGVPGVARETALRRSKTRTT
jgi:hypothetical protein